MIGILLNDNAYEQDIRELLMAFYPGETFAHQKGAEVSFYVEGNVNQDRTQFELFFLDDKGQREKQAEALKSENSVSEQSLPWPEFPRELI